MKFKPKNSLAKRTTINEGNDITHNRDNFSNRSIPVNVAEDKMPAFEEFAWHNGKPNNSASHQHIGIIGMIGTYR